MKRVFEVVRFEAVVALAGIASTACSQPTCEETLTCELSSPADAGASDADFDAGPGDSEAECGNPEQVCCSSGRACMGPLACLSGMCACAGGKVACGESCADLNSDTRNCGACGRDCLTGACQTGLCQPIALATDVDALSTIRVDDGHVY
jgi:hypothetical protein